MKLTTKVMRSSEEPPTEVDLSPRSDGAVNITINGYVFMILEKDGSFRLNRFASSSMMGAFCKQMNIPTYKALGVNMLKLVVR